MVSLTHFRSVDELADGSRTLKLGQEGCTSKPRSLQEKLDLAYNSNGQLQQQQASHNKFDQPEVGMMQNQNLTRSNQQDKSKGSGGGNAVVSSQSKSSGHFEIRWTNLTYQVEAKWYRKGLTGLLQAGENGNEASTESKLRSRTKILNNLNGSVKSGQVTAILGPSGAGKTSLLGCLTGKYKSGVSGCVQVMADRSEPMSICTIPQKDFLLNQLTVRENLWFASRLKHPEDDFDHDSNIERVLELLKLESCIDTRISKISGGQHKRVSIAQELLSDPDILILDEPTSGLDSLTCYKTVMVLRDLARLSPNPMAILVTIHQPQREVFDLFNHVYILATGGRAIYEGDPRNSIRTINEFGAGLEFDAHQYNPASYLVEIASGEFGEKPIESLIEHQQRDFRRRTNEQDLLAAQKANSAGLLTVAGQPGAFYYDEASGRYLSTTPNLRKRQSPMVARFKSTLSNLTGIGSGSPLSPRLSARSHSNMLLASGQLPTGQAISTISGGFANEAFMGSQNHLAMPDSNISIQQNHNFNTSPEATATAISTTTTSSISHTKASQRPEVIGNEQANSKGPIDIPSLNSKLGYEERLIMASNGEPIEEGEFYLDDRLQTHKHNHKGHFLRHCKLLTKRSWLCLCKDPMLTTLRFSAHIIVPLLITLVYGSRVGKPNACPIYETEMDLIDYARNGPKRLLTLQSELRCTFENVGLFFLSIYAFTFSTMCLTSLSFPLNMHVLLKEVRNGWYSLPTYFIGKTLADFPLEFILPVVTLMITYPLTGQPESYLEWRFIAATSVFVITSLIAQTQGLIFGALFMNAMQAAVFVAPVSTTPLILLSGFLIRISQMPSYLQTLSTFSYFRYAIESLTIIRYGFDQCPCDSNQVTGKPVRAAGVPDQLRTMTNYWLSTFDSPSDSGSSFNDTNELIETTTSSSMLSAALASSMPGNLTSDLAMTTLAPGSGEPDQQVDFFQDLTVLLARANSFGAEIKTCKDLKPYPMIDFSLHDEQLYVWSAALIATLIGSKIINYLVVKYSVKWRL